MFQETKRSASDESFPPLSFAPASFPSQHPIFRDISDLPRPSPSDFVSSSLTSMSGPDVYRSIPDASGGATFAPDSNWNGVSAFGPSAHGYPLQTRKDLDMPQFSSSETYWNDPFSSVHFNKAKSIDDLSSPLIESFVSPAAVINAVAPPVPDYVDPFYHFLCTAAPSEVFSSVAASLKRNGVDVQPKPEKFRMKCTSYPNGSMVDFVVRIYSKDKTQCMVECQRRKGDVVPFANLFKTLKHQMDPKTRDSALVVQTTRDEEMNSGEHSQETAQCLLLMASSHFVDVKSKAVEALANISCHDRHMQEVLIKQGSLDVLLDGCSKFDQSEDVHRPALTALANLCEGRADVCRTIADKGLRCLSQKYTCPKENCPQVVRECARVLCNIGHNCMKEQLGNVDCLSSAIHNLSRSQDPATLQRAHELEDCFELEGIST